MRTFTENEIKKIINLYQTEVPSTHKLAPLFKTTHQKIRDILIDNGITINKKGGQLKYGREIVMDRHRTKNIMINGKKLIAVCKLTGKIFMDSTNRSGALTEHIKNHYKDVIIPTKYKRKRQYQQTGAYWHEEFFDLVERDSLKAKDRESTMINQNDYLICQICGMKFKHINNVHLQTHNITPEDYKLKYGTGSLMSNSLTLLTTKRLAHYNEDLIHFSPVSKDETEVNALITNLGFTVETRNRKLLAGKEIDLLIPSLRLGIEYNGNKFHTEYYGGKYPNYHLDKLTMLNSQGYGLIQIFEDEWVTHKDMVVNKIKHILGVSSGIKIGARKCVIKEILTHEKNTFLDQYHIQGRDTSTIKLGAFYNNDLVGVMTFRTITTTEFELTRFATNYNYLLPGLSSKMLCYFIKQFSPSNIISFADRRWTIKKDDNLYTKLNFKLVGITKPDYKYYNTKIHRYKRFHKFEFRKQNLIKKYGLDPNLTEKEMTKQLGYDRIWDCGLFKYELKIS